MNTQRTALALPVERLPVVLDRWIESIMSPRWELDDAELTSPAAQAELDEMMQESDRLYRREFSRRQRLGLNRAPRGLECIGLERDNVQEAAG